MKKIQILAASILLMSVALSFSGANAEENGKGGEGEKGNNSSQEFKGAAIRSHGHPIANLNEAPTNGSRQSQSSSLLAFRLPDHGMSVVQIVVVGHWMREAFKGREKIGSGGD